jgi:hypothetical protein
VKSLLNEELREKLDLLRQIAPEKIVAMYQEIAAESGNKPLTRPPAFCHMIDAIIENADARVLARGGLTEV